MPLLEAIVSLGAGQAIGRLRERVRPNPYAPTLVDQQAVAVDQAGRLRPGTSGIAGSEAEYYIDPQGASSIGWTRAVQDVTSRALPPAQFLPGDPGADPDDATVLRDFSNRPVRLEDNPAWGVNQRGSPHVLTTRINPPLATTPLPRAVAAARAAGAPQGEQDAFDTLYEG